MDVPEPPQIVFEQPAPCRDSAQADTALRAALASSKAPATAWTVKLRIEREGSVLHANGAITDPTGAPLSKRTLNGRGDECSGLARAIGLWASLVLDAEVERAGKSPPAAAPSAPPSPPPPPEPAPPPAAPEPPEKPNLEAELFLAHPADERDFEIGAASYAMSVSKPGMMAGGSLFLVTEGSDAWFFRPSISFGRAVTPVTAGGAYALNLAARLDGCKRIPGNYLERRGIQLDICLGAEGGVQHIDGGAGLPPNDVPLGAVGPSLDLRGELASDLSVLVRGVAEVNFLSGVNNTNDTGMGWLFARAEVGVSWRFR